MNGELGLRRVKSHHLRRSLVRRALKWLLGAMLQGWMTGNASLLDWTWEVGDRLCTRTDKSVGWHTVYISLDHDAHAELHWACDPPCGTILIKTHPFGK
jgi:hypothetical protein